MASGLQINQVRVARLKELVEKAGGIADFVRQYRNEAADKPIDPAHVSQLLGGHRQFGEKAARAMEERAGLESGYFDRLTGAVTVEATGGVPVVGTAQLGDDGYWLELEYPTGQGEGFVRYPMKDPNTYALRVKGDSMRPRIKPGEFVVIEPNHSVVAGEEVMVQTKDGRSMVKILAWRRGGTVELHSINEDHRPITIEEGNIAKMHYVGAIVKPSWYYEKAPA